LWPRTYVATAAIKYILGGEEAISKSRTEAIMGDSAYVILTSNSKKTTGQFFIDDEVLASVGVTDLKKYLNDKKLTDKDLMPDGFLWFLLNK